MIKLEHVKKVYPNVTPLADVSTEIHDGDVISVIGPSGTGKSTLLRCINLLERPDGGKIFLDNEEITSPKSNVSKIRQKMGMVFQSFNLFGHLTVIENIMLAPVKLKGVSRQDAFDEGMKLLRQVGLSEKMLNYPHELSGGQKQRIAIARALAMDPSVILFDEPTSALDPTMVGEVQAVIRDFAKTGKTMMIVTHEMNFARTVSNRVFYMDEGGIYEDGTPQQIFGSPKRDKTRRFIQRLKVLEIKINSKDYDFPATIASIENYCRKNLVANRICNHLQLAFEELVQQILLPGREKPEVNIVIEYSEEKNEAIMNINHGLNGENPLDTADELSMSVLHGISDNINSDRETGTIKLFIH
ncbi:MAG: amino acid ABC transporter ATP-binding protein [Synergistaceae bacterium]|nr:amino acid ABC transporter ATP-binding protein [Synergistaceae bacterium]